MDPENAGGVVVLAAGAHPDDIEFSMAGTLALLARSGALVHAWSLTDGSLGSLDLSRRETARVRFAEAGASADLIGARLHPPIAADMRLIYNTETLARATAIIREAKPLIVLAPSPEDYHPDHESASRIVVSAALARGLPGFVSEPAMPPWDGDIVIYHAMPHGLRGRLRDRVRAGQYVNTDTVMDLKKEMLSCHASQRELLIRTQGADPVAQMEWMAEFMGHASGRSATAEGWRRHVHTGLSGIDNDPLSEILGPLCWTDPDYEVSLG
ncbi:MAG: PIG-L deacetylase family protein [Candidatus Geothermincolia bacterium]